jgi:opacity protein-like surface antigen
MTRLLVAAIVLIALCTSFLEAQDSTPKVQVFGGYSLLHRDNGGLTNSVLDISLREPNSPFAVGSTFGGWNAQGQYNVNHWLGIAADFSGHDGSQITAARGVVLSGLPKGTDYTFLAGPVASFRNNSRVSLFIHALVGVDRVSLSASTISGVSRPLSSVATAYTDVAVALGGGADCRVARHFSLRLAQLDDLETTHNFNKFYGSVFPTGVFTGLSTHQRNLRVSTGIIVKF